MVISTRRFRALRSVADTVHCIPPWGIRASMTDERSRVVQEHEGVVVVGAGAAGHGCARALSEAGFPGRIRVVNGEGGHPVNRTLVDTGILPGLLTSEQIALPPVADVEVIDGRAIRLRPKVRSVVLEDGRTIAGDAIVLACGAVPRTLDRQIEVEHGVQQHLLHGVDDAERLRRALPEPAGTPIVVLGAGFIGAEVASHYAAAGARVTLIGRSPLPLRAAVGAVIASRLAVLHAERVDARLGVGVSAIRTRDRRSNEGSGVVVELDDGTAVTGDVLVIALGSRPAAAWAGFADAIPVDDRFRVQAHPGLYAAGSAAAPLLPWGRVRTDHWDAAAAQGAHAARALLHDLGLESDPGPWAPVQGFSLMVHGSVLAACGVFPPDAAEASVEFEGGGLVTEFRAGGVLNGVAGWNAGAHLVHAAARLTRGG
ncbi:FAD-dependent oxidoreductase [Agrococcus sp. 1P02AA]|uniref:FAD-dependent oxidoreductase n=1 Tax=Agrococcus sp. 1P02AA TaxID=3132259 RepID=UPI0039A45094